MKKPKICKLFFDTHMGLGHQGLAILARKGKVDLDMLDEGDLLMFLNRAGDKMKMLGSRGRVLAYLRMPKGRIMKEALQYIPRTFGHDGFNYDKACLIAINKKLGIDQPEPVKA